MTNSTVYAINVFAKNIRIVETLCYGLLVLIFDDISTIDRQTPYR